MMNQAILLDENRDVHSGVRITIENVGKSFGDNQVLNNISLDINAGEFVAIVGKSGSGKSTLLRIISGLEQPTTGKLLFDGVPMKDSETNATMMYQDSRLLPWKKAIDNVGLGLSGDWKPKAEEALKHVGLEQYKDVWPSTLSGGQKQRVALARALVHQPSLLLLDEPLSALDALTRLEMQNLIEGLWLEQGFTALLVTHDVREAVRLADRVILIEDGTITLNQENNAGRPRDVSDVALARMEKEILERIMGL
jgi:sulfonate transport system ATP-binding protein